MIIKYSKLIKSFVVIYTLDDQYVRNTLIRNEFYNADKICVFRSLSEAFGWRCAYSIHNFCGKRVEISEDIGDQVIYNVYHGCCSSPTASNTSTLFGVKELRDISDLGGSIYSIRYYANKIQ